MADFLWGLRDLEEYAQNRLATIPAQDIRDLTNETIRVHELALNSFLNQVAQFNPAWNYNPNQVMKFREPTVFYDVDEDGKADPRRRKQEYLFGLPLARGEGALGWSLEGWLTNTVQQYNDDLLGVFVADKQRTYARIREALFRNTAWTYLPIEEDYNRAPVNVGLLANGDSRWYMLKNGNFVTANHFAGQAASIADLTDPFPTQHDLLTRYANYSGGDVVAFVPTNLRASIMALEAVIPYTPENRLIPSPLEARLDPAVGLNTYFGDRVLGWHESGVIIIEWAEMPDNYMLFMDINQRVVGGRNHPDAGLQGLYATEYVSHYGNELGARWRRQQGWGVVNPIGASLVQIGSSTYTAPEILVF